jgi:D-arabinose 1-dehydrogenase-like Zn-dependent alcohol dehydrogenase
LSIRRSRLVVPVIAGLVFVALAVGFVSQSGEKHFRLRVGDSVSIPSLHWTCLASTLHGRPIFTCTSDEKPVHGDTISQRQIIVGGSGRPLRVHGGYRFRF